MKYLIAAGGTGGHIYPALAIADQIKKTNPSAEIIFVGTHKGLENQILPKAGYPLEHLPIGRLNSNVSLSERLFTLVLLPFALLKSAYLVFKHRPQFVLGVGGHASGPMLLAASLMGKKTYIWEPNALPGLANRWLAPFVGECLVVFEDAKKFLRSKRCRRVGMPIRKEIDHLQALRDTDSNFHVLIFGGSQGARPINNAVLAMLKLNPSWRGSIRFVHQTGPHDIQRISAEYQSHGFIEDGSVQVFEYLHDMDKRYAWADLVISRAGTGTLSELAATQKPSILIPLATSADNHQQKNAEALERDQAAKMLLQKDLTAESLKTMIQKFFEDKNLRESMSRKVQKFHEPDAAKAIAFHLLESSKVV